MARFWTSVLLFHAGLGWVAFRIGVAWTGRLTTSMPRFRWTLALARDAACFTAAMLLAGLAAVLSPKAGFTLLRLWCQGLFGEGVLLALWLALVHAGSGLLWRAAVPALAATVLIGAYAEAYHREPHDLQVRRHAVDLTGGAVGARTLRILHLTDIQTAEVGRYEEHAIREGLCQKPDLIVLTGDYVHERLRPTRARATADLRELLGRLQAPLGVVAVRGDTDQDWPVLFEGTRVRCLDDEAATLALPGGGTLVLIGLGPRASHARRAGLALSVVEDAPQADLRIAMGHAPDFVTELGGRTRVDLVLAGHTHGGQVALPFLGPPWISSRLPRRFAGDVHDYQGIPVHVSRGVGMERGTAPQIRFLCPPEICVIDVRYAPR